jgi:hypothetical protein
MSEYNAEISKKSELFNSFQSTYRVDKGLFFAIYNLENIFNTSSRIECFNIWKNFPD